MTVIILSLAIGFGSIGITWIYMCRVSADRNGWLRLTERYAFNGVFDGARFDFQSAIFNGFAFTGTLNIGVVRDGLYLRGGILLRAFHPALVVPWEEVGAERFERSHSAGYTLTFSSFPEMGCDLSETTIQRLSRAIPPEWNIQPPWQGADA